MKAIMMSINPKWVAKILNGEKTIEIRTKFPKDYVGWVYIYCTKSQNEELWWYDGTEDFRLYKKGIANEEDTGWHLQNGKVVARFWCDKGEEIKTMRIGGVRKFYIKNKDQQLTESLMYNSEQDIRKKACLEHYELEEYFINKFVERRVWNPEERIGYAWHIDNLKVFDKPKEISEFKVKGFERYKVMGSPYGDLDSVAYHYEKREVLKPLSRAPQSWCYVEV